MNSKLLRVLEEQIAMMFTGKVNILASFNRQYLGHILLRNGEIFHVIFNQHRGLKGFYQLLIQEQALQSFDYVVEPEIVSENERQIHYPFGVIKNRLDEILKLHQAALKLRPPENVKILIDSGIMHNSAAISAQEYEVLQVLTEWNDPYDIYQNCQLLDHEITMALVSLRKKGGLKIIAPKDLS